MFRNLQSGEGNINSFKVYLFGTYCISGIVMGTRDMLVSKINVTDLIELTF